MRITLGGPVTLGRRPTVDLGAVGIATVLEAGHVHPAVVGVMPAMVGHLSAPLRTPGAAILVSGGPTRRPVLPRPLGIAVKAMFVRPGAALPVTVVTVAALAMVTVTSEVTPALAVARVAAEGMRRAAMLM